MEGVSPNAMATAFQDHRQAMGEKRMGIGLQSEERGESTGRLRLPGSRSFSQTEAYRTKQSATMKAAWQKRRGET